MDGIPTPKTAPALVARLFVHTTLFVLAIAALLFVAAGTWDWTAAWVFLVELEILSLAVGLWLAAYDPALLEERMRLTHREQAGWDRLFLSFVFGGFMTWIGLLGLARREGALSASASLMVVGALMVAASMGLSWWTFKTNRFAVPQVRVQAQRGQTVIDSGPYAIVRHPLYAGAILFFGGVPLQLGAWWGLVIVPVFAACIAWRIGGEEEALRRDLAGYDAYAARVRHRLVPGVW